MSKLDDPNIRKSIAKELLYKIDEYCIQLYDDGPRYHLGASIIGSECSREIWYTFRWLFHKKFSGRMYRLFNRGHLEEKRNLEWLRGIGCLVTDVDLYGNQIRIKGKIGHFGGSLDASGYLPTEFDIEEELLFEFKTKKTGAEFNELKKKGVKACNWQHYVQMSIYGKNNNIKYAIYFVTNKNDDELHIEIVPLDWKLAEEKEELAKELISRRQVPPRPFASRAYIKCKSQCDYVGICWDNVAPEVNCRSCWKARAEDNGNWFCEQFNMEIPKNYLKNGCPHWEAVR